MPTAFASANGVGGKATRPSFANSAFAFSYASVASDGIFSGFDAKNEVSAVRGVLRIAGDLAGP